MSAIRGFVSNANEADVFEGFKDSPSALPSLLIHDYFRISAQQ